MDLNVSAYMVPIPSKRDIREIEDITHRLKKVLSDVELLFDNEDDEAASIMSERREFQSRYGDISAQVDAREKERSEILKSLAEMLDGDSPNLDVLHGSKDGENTSEMNGLWGEIETTKMGFQKLQKLKEEMHNLASNGKPTKHLQEQKTNLKLKVVEKFKLMYSAKKLRNQNKTIGNHWKHAAEEIVDVLHRIRAEGTDGVKDLEAELLRVEKSITRQAENMVKLEHIILEKQKTIDSLTKSFAVSTNENELYKSEVERYQDQAISLKKEVRKLRAEMGSHELPEMADNHAQTFLSMVTLINAVNDEISAASILNEGSLRSEPSKQCECSSEVQELLKKIGAMETKIIDKETQIMKMEHQLMNKAEGLGAKSIKSSAKSIKSSDPSAGRDDKLPVIVIQEEPVVREDGQHNISETGNIQDVNQKVILALTEDKEQLLLELDKLREQNAQAAREIVTLKYTTEQQPSTMARTFTNTQNERGHILESNQHTSRAPAPANVKGEDYIHPNRNGQAYQDYVQPSGHARPGQDYIQPDKHGRAGQDYIQSNVDGQTGQDTVRKSKIPGRSIQDNTFEVRRQQHTYQSHQDNELVCQVRSKQNDIPYKTPVSETDWSAFQHQRRNQHHSSVEGTPSSSQQSKVLPPVSPGNTSSNYLQFPTKGCLPPQAPRQLYKYQDSAADVSARHDSTENNQTELETFVEEIQSYSEYLKDAMEGEISRLTRTNEELRRRLSERSLQQFDKLYSSLLNMPGNTEESSPSSSEPADHTGQLRRGTMEAPKIPSHYTSHDAFAAVKNGERFIQQRNVGREERRRLTSSVRSQGSLQNDSAVYVSDHTARGVIERIQPLGVDRNRPGVFDKGDISLGGFSALSGNNQSCFIKSKKKANIKMMDDEMLNTPTSESGGPVNITLHKRNKIGGAVSRLQKDERQEWMTSPSSSSSRSTGAGRSDWNRRREQYQAGIKSIQGLTGTSLHFKQTMAQQFTRHFCLSEIQNAKDVESVLPKDSPSTMKDMRGPTRDMSRLGGSGTQEQLSKQDTYKATSMTSLFGMMTSLVEATKEENGSLLQAYEPQKLPLLVQAMSLNTLDNSYRYSTPTMIMHPIDGEADKRLLLKLPTAKYPGRGYVVLQTDRFPIYDGHVLRCSTADEKPLSHRPVPKSHKELNARHILILGRQRDTLQKEQTLWNIISSEDGMKFDALLDESLKNCSSGDEPESVRSIIKAAHDQLFNPEQLQHKYEGLLTKDTLESC